MASRTTHFDGGRPGRRRGPISLAGRRLVAIGGLALAPFAASDAWAAVRYVSQTGTDNAACSKAAPCATVRHAVDVADPGDTISIGKGKFVEPTGIVISKNLTIQGSGIFSTRISAGLEGYSVFFISSQAFVTITGLDVMGGRAENGGGIANHGTLVLKAVRLRKNHASVGGGGIYNGGSLSISNAEIALNVAGDLGGGLWNTGTATLNEVAIAANSAPSGSGGGIFSSSAIEWADVIPLLVTRSVVSHNRGGGIVNASWMRLINSTISRNKAFGVSTAHDTRSELIHVTVADNGHPPYDADLVPAGLVGGAGSEIVLTNTIVANNVPTQCHLPFGLDPVVNAVGSLISDNSCAQFPGGGNLIGVDPKLAPLQWSTVGSTRLHALLPGSPAIDAAAPGSCAQVDQRGVLRNVDGDKDGSANCDIGAFEFLPLKRGWSGELKP